MQLSTGLCSTPLPPPFPADAIPFAAGTSGCLRRRGFWNLKMGSCRQGKGDAVREQVRVMLSLCHQMFPRQRSLQLLLSNAHSRGALVPPGVLLPPFNSLRNLPGTPWHSSGHPPHPHTCHLQSVTATEPRVGFWGLSSWKSNVFPL